VPWEIAKKYIPKAGKVHRTIRYSPAQKPHETPELLQLAGELHNHKVLDALTKHFRAGDMKAFYATAEKVLKIQCGNPVVRSVVKGDQLVTERDHVDQAIAEYFQEVYGGGEDFQMNADENTAMWERLEIMAESALEMFTAGDVEAAMKASNFNKGLGPDGFDGTFLRPGDSSHRFTKDITAQILGLLNDPASIPPYLYDGRLVPLSKNKGLDQAELKDIRPIVVRSHVAKILEKAIMAKVAAAAPHLL
jgi:hypothetical protein